jgi:uncharacterized 2Fe-2S/4Fe-4S cluster protein (DUF4445 family)
MVVDIKDIPQIVLTLVVLIITAAVGVLIMNALQGGIGDTDTNSNVNETLSGVTVGTNNTLASTSRSNISTSSVTVTNATEGQIISEGNYTIEPINPLPSSKSTEAVSFIFRLKNTTSDTDNRFEGQNVNITYNTVDFNQKGNILNNGSISTGNITAQIPTVGVLIGLGVLIGIVSLLIFAGRRDEF